jgi:acyl-CoA synthetase (AMP-forming)/AMP-acid ligase II
MSVPILSCLSAQLIKSYHEQGFWKNETIYELAKRWALKNPDSIAIRDRFNTLTYSELLDAADNLAGWLDQKGICPGERITFWMPDRIESVLIVLASSRGGYVVCPSPHRNHTVEEVCQLVDRMRASTFFYQSGFGSDASGQNTSDLIGNRPTIRCFTEIPPPGADMLLFNGLLNSKEIPPPEITEPDRVSYIAFTSGSTGNPKGVMHSDNSQLVTARGQSSDWQIDTNSVVYSMSPFSHNLGMGAYLTTLTGGGQFVIHDRQRGESNLDRIIEVGATYLVGVPTHAIDILEQASKRGLQKLGKVSGFRISGAAAPKTVFSELFHMGVIPQSGYGMTETNGHQYTLPNDDINLITESSGKACPGYEIRIFDPENPEIELSHGEIGLVAGKGASLMLGYYDDQVATETSFNAAGWFLTGDLGWIDHKGYLRLTGRRKEVIIRGGHNINPEHIEEIAMRHSHVERAAVLPIPDDRLGERACIAIMLRDGVSLEFDELLTHLRENGLSRYDMPEFGVHLTDIPLMSNGKIEKRAILKELIDGALRPTGIGKRK